MEKLYRLVNAATGSGKTIAYLAPIIHHLQKLDPRIERSAGTFGAWNSHLGGDATLSFSSYTMLMNFIVLPLLSFFVA